MWHTRPRFTEEQTEGWIAVLRLAALSLRSTADRCSIHGTASSLP